MDLTIIQNNSTLIPKLFDFQGIECECLLHRIYDGDSLRACFLYYGKPITVAIRVLGIDTPELRTRCPHEKQLALKARDVARNLLNNRILPVQFFHNDKYGRTLANITLPNGVEYGRHMISQKLALPYLGGTKAQFDNLYKK